VAGEESGEAGVEVRAAVAAIVVVREAEVAEEELSAAAAEDPAAQSLAALPTQAAKAHPTEELTVHGELNKKTLHSFVNYEKTFSRPPTT